MDNKLYLYLYWLLIISKEFTKLFIISLDKD